MIKHDVMRAAAALIFRVLLLLPIEVMILSPAGLSLASASSLDARPAVNYVASQSKFVLDATKMAISADAVTYSWTLTGRPLGSLAVLTDSGNAIAHLSADANGPFTVELVLSEGGVDQAPVVLQLKRDNVEPVSTLSVRGGAAPATPGSVISL